MNKRPLLTASTLLGIGMGGFFDGILFHQILQVHSMLSNWVFRTSQANVEINMFWDGLFHAFCYLTVVAGLWLLWKAIAEKGARFDGRVYVGGMLLGWGLFNLVEGVIDHEILQVHHVIQNGNHLVWDMVFLASGVILIGIGWQIVKRQPAAARPARP